MEKTGYKRKWVEKVLEDLVGVGEIARVEAGRSYRYRLPVYDPKTHRCTCVLSDHIAPTAAAYGQLVPEHGQLVPEYGQSPAGNTRHHKRNPAEPSLDPCIEPERVRTHEEAKRPHGRPQDIDPTYLVDVRQLLRQAGY